MQYNLLNYGNYSDYCTTSNNNINHKDGYLRTILNYIKPDIFAVNEMFANANIAKRLLDSTLNVNGISHFKAANYLTLSGGSLANMLYYNSQKLVLLSQSSVPTSVRDFNIYNLYVNDPIRLINGDTAFLTCAVTHLKAGNTSSDASERANMTQTFMNYLNSLNKPGNYLLMGDLNVYGSGEQAYQNLVNHSNLNIRFYDPLNKAGNWNENSNFAAIHTQSTHTASGCHASGGLDDRFDFILASQSIISGTNYFKYISNSYKAIGNDGNHFNGALNFGTNNSAPQQVIDALYNNSDHLPVIIDLAVGEKSSGFEESKKYSFQVYFNNPLISNAITIRSIDKNIVTVELFAMNGILIFRSENNRVENETKIMIPDHLITKGAYVLKVQDKFGNFIIKKLIKI